jgi:hypothetical protein
VPNLVQSILLTGASGTGKSTLIRGALEHYGSGLVLLAPGKDEIDSYVGLEEPKYCFGAFDDLDFNPQAKEWTANGHLDAVKWLQQRRKELESDLAAGRELRYRVLGVDTISALARLAYNATLAHFKRDTPPPAQSPDGAAFYGHLRITLEQSARGMRALRGLGLHWLVAAHPTEAEATPMQQTAGAPSSSKIMPDIPGGFKNQLPSFFTTVLDVNIGTDKKHYVRWEGDPKRVTKSRLGPLSATGKIELPIGAKAAWEVVGTAIEKAMAKLVSGA